MQVEAMQRIRERRSAHGSWNDPVRRNGLWQSSASWSLVSQFDVTLWRCFLAYAGEHIKEDQPLFVYVSWTADVYLINGLLSRFALPRSRLYSQDKQASHLCMIPKC